MIYRFTCKTERLSNKENVMNKKPILILIFSIILLSGCGTMPQTADEFRKAIPGAFLGKFETLEVNRPFKKVARAFKKMAPKCLDKTVKATSTTHSQYGPRTSVMVTDYNPTVRVTKKRAELHVQEKMEGSIKVHKEPEGGYYSLVVDATPVSKRKTRLDIYGPSIGKKNMIKAIKGWASGKVKGCPDLTK